MTQQIIDNVIKLDKPGRDKTKQLCNNLGWEFIEPDRADLAYDCIIYINSTTIVAEIKNRDEKCKKYDTLFLQADKYNNLLKWKNKLNADFAWYINWIGDDCYIFDIEKTDQSTLTTKWMNKITADNTSGKVPKQIYELNKKDAVLIEKL